MSTVTAAPRRHEVISQREGLKIVRLTVPAGGRIGEHAANSDVIAIAVRGNGIFTVEGVNYELQPGRVLEMAAGAQHAISAESELEIVVVHARLDTKPNLVAIRCGAAQ